MDPDMNLEAAQAVPLSFRVILFKQLHRHVLGQGTKPQLGVNKLYLKKKTMCVHILECFLFRSDFSRFRLYFLNIYIENILLSLASKVLHFEKDKSVKNVYE